MNFAAEGLLAQIPAQEDRLDRAAQLTQRLVGRVHHLGAAKPAQDRLRVGGFCLHRGCIFDHLVILLLDLIPVDRTGEDRLQVGKPRSHADIGKSQLLASDRFQARSEEHTSELQSLMRISYAVFCLKKKKYTTKTALTEPATSPTPARHMGPEITTNWRAINTISRTRVASQ